MNDVSVIVVDQMMIAAWSYCDVYDYWVRYLD